MYTSFPAPTLNIKGLYLLMFLLITSFSYVQAQGEWKKNSKGHDVYVYKPSSVTPLKVTTKPSPTYRKEIPERPSKKTAETNVDYKLYYDKEVDKNEMRIARQMGKWGLMNKNGFYSVPLIYDSILPSGTSNLYAAKQNGKWGFITWYGTPKIMLIYDAIIKPFGFAGSYATVVENGIQFQIKENGLRPSVGELTGGYDVTEPFSEGLACVNKRYSDDYYDSYWGFIDNKGKVIIPLIYNFAGSFKDGLAFVRAKDGGYGFIDKKGTVVIPLQYDYASSFKESLAYVKKGLYVGFIDKTGKIIIPLEYFEGVSFNEGLTALNKNGKWGYLDTKGNIKIPFIYEDANSFIDGKAFVKQGGESFQIDKSGIRLGKIPVKYDVKEPISDGLIRVKKGGVWGIIDIEGTVIIPLQYRSISDFKEGLSIVSIMQTAKYGFIDKTGKIIIPTIWDVGDSFSEGLAPMRKDGYWGFIDKKGNTVIEFKYKYIAKGFTNGIAEVYLNDGIIKINKSGEKVSQ